MNKLLTTAIALATLISSGFASQNLKFGYNQTESNVNQSVTEIDLELTNYILLNKYGFTAENRTVTVVADNKQFLNISDESVEISRGMINDIKTQLQVQLVEDQIIQKFTGKIDIKPSDISDELLKIFLKNEIKCTQD